MADKRRDKGNGGITKRKDGRYTVSYKGHSTTVKTLALAKAKIKEWQTKEARNEPLNIKRQTVETYLYNYILNYKKNNLKPKSLIRIMQTYENQIKPTIGCLQMGSITTENIQQMINTLYKQSSYSTVKKAYVLVNECMNHALNTGQIAKNPCVMAKLPKATETSINESISCYTSEQIELIIQEATAKYNNGKYKYRYGYVILLLLATGMREGEALYLKWADIDFTLNRIYIHGNVVDVKGGAIEQETPKTSNSTRYIPMNNNAREALLMLQEIIHDDMRVIATAEHKILNPSAIRRMMNSILKRCCISDVKNSVHALRHTFATRLIRNGTDIKTVSKLLGHSSVDVTMNIYYHISEEQEQQAMLALDDIF